MIEASVCLQESSNWPRRKEVRDVRRELVVEELVCKELEVDSLLNRELLEDECEEVGGSALCASYHVCIL